MTAIKAIKLFLCGLWIVIMTSCAIAFYITGGIFAGIATVLMKSSEEAQTAIEMEMPDYDRK